MELLDKAKNLRKNSTSMETKIWNSLRSRRFQGFKFRRQCPFGNYIVDFVCIEKKLIIEIDGGQHNDCRQHEYDNRRTDSLNNLGYDVLRFWNNEVQQQFDLVMDVIYKYLMNDI
jgi:very-short-patch-repair endonuclease